MSYSVLLTVFLCFSDFEDFSWIFFLDFLLISFSVSAFWMRSFSVDTLPGFPLRPSRSPGNSGGEKHQKSCWRVV